MFHRPVRPLNPRKLLWIFVGVGLIRQILPVPSWAQSPNTVRLEAYLASRLESARDQASTWRLLARIRRENGDPGAAHQALQKAVELEPDNVAALFDLGRLEFEQNDSEAAARHFLELQRLAPDSHYARQAESYLTLLPTSTQVRNVVPAGFEVKRFDGSDTSEKLEEASRGVGSARRYLLSVETGALFNSNVALTPLNRFLSPRSRSAFQGFVSPQLEIPAIQRDGWWAGPMFLGYFNLNEGNFRDLHLQSYQPGFFVEGEQVTVNSISVAPRLQYEFTHDEFGGETFGNRHAVTLSGRVTHHQGHTSLWYSTIDCTDLWEDGTTPTVTSQDGWTYTIGHHHTVESVFRYLNALRGGVIMQFADLEGSDFSYYGVHFYAEAEVPLPARMTFQPHLGWGYRNYSEFNATPSRNEHIWRAGVELKKQIDEFWAISGVFHYDLFDSNNSLFEAERFVSGAVMRFEY